MIVKSFAFQSPEYHASVSLRYQLLRAPLGLQFKQEDLDKEGSDFHIGAFELEEIIGILILSPKSDSLIKMRQVGVANHTQGQGVGRKMVEFAEAFCKEKGYTKIELNARDVAIPFYDKLNYTPVGEQFVEVGIVHQKMIKEL